MNPRQQKRKKYVDPGTVIIVRNIFWGVLVFAGVALLITALWYGTRISALTIETVSVEGGVTINHELVKEKANGVLDEGAYLRLVPKRFFYTYPKENLLARVQEIPRIKDVRIEEINPTEIKISFTEYIPETLWCDYSDDSSCYFLDNQGFAFAEAPSLTGESLVRYVSSEKEFMLGTTPFLVEEYTHTKEFTRLLSEVGWFVTKIEINAAGDVFYTLAKGSELKTTVAETPELLFENLMTIIRSEEFSHLTPGNFKYIDLRFGTRVFVNEELVIDSASSTATSSINVFESESDVLEE
jgi:hypothetical protein